MKPRLPTRYWALAILVVLIAAQVHVWVDSGPAQRSGHICEFCVSGGWAIVSASPGLEVLLVALPLGAEPTQAQGTPQRLEASAPRAPPQA